MRLSSSAFPFGSPVSAWGSARRGTATPMLSGENGEIAHWLLSLTETHKRRGFGLCFAYLRNVKGFRWNHKWVYRIYQELELNLRIKPRARLKRERPEMLSVPTAPNQV